MDQQRSGFQIDQVDSGAEQALDRLMCVVSLVETTIKVRPLGCATYLRRRKWRPEEPESGL
jgi:hypothetical protein